MHLIEIQRLEHILRLHQPLLLPHNCAANGFTEQAANEALLVLRVQFVQPLLSQLFLDLKKKKKKKKRPQEG